MGFATTAARAATLARLADELRSAAWDLALEYVEEGLRDDAIPSLARLARREQLGDVPTVFGFAARDIVTEFLLLRRVLWRFVSAHAEKLDAEDVLEAERRLNDTLDRL